LAEFIGTFMLVLAGCGAIMVNVTTGALGHSGVAASFGLVVGVMIAATGHISSAHFNPAVTLAFALIRRFAWRDVPLYIVAQVSAAVAAAATLRLLFGDVAMLGATIPAGSVTQSFVLEVLLTAALMFVIVAVATDAKAAGNLAPLAIGAVVALGALWGGPISGASMNPARSFGPALISGVWTVHWLYWVAPCIGATIGAWAYEIVRPS
jgi:MIP family channel proteins